MVRVAMIAVVVPALFAGALALPAAAVDGGGQSGSADRSHVDDTAQAHQVGTYDYLVSPDYTGLVPAKDAAAGLTLGLGTFDDLDGELVLVGGVLMRVSTDGKPTPVTDDRTVPFFQGVRFRAARSAPVPPGTTCAALGQAVITLAQTSRGMVAVRVRGTFSDLVTRSVAAQTEPFPPLAQVVAGQTVFPLGQRRAVLVGFWTGPTMAGLGAPGLHLHGVTADRTAGGHVLSCVAGPDVQLSVQPLDAVRVTAGH